MSRTATWSSSNYMLAGASPISAAPLTIACWSKGTVSNKRNCVYIHTDGAASGRHQFALGATSGTNGVARFVVADGSGSTALEGADNYVENEWNHLLAVASSSTSRYAYTNGVAGSEGTTSRVPSGLDEVFLGTRNAQNEHAVGAIAEASVWDAVLTQAEIDLLNLGYSALFVRPQNLVAYWPLVGRSDPEMDLFDRNTALSEVGTVSVDTHPPIIYPRRSQIIIPPAFAIAAGRPQGPLGHPFSGPFGGPI